MMTNIIKFCLLGFAFATQSFGYFEKVNNFKSYAYKRDGKPYWCEENGKTKNGGSIDSSMGEIFGILDKIKETSGKYRCISEVLESCSAPITQANLNWFNVATALGILSREILARIDPSSLEAAVKVSSVATKIHITDFLTRRNFQNNLNFEESQEDCMKYLQAIDVKQALVIALEEDKWDGRYNNTTQVLKQQVEGNIAIKEMATKFVKNIYPQNNVEIDNTFKKSGGSAAVYKVNISGLGSKIVKLGSQSEVEAAEKLQNRFNGKIDFNGTKIIYPTNIEIGKRANFLLMDVAEGVPYNSVISASGKTQVLAKILGNAIGELHRNGIYHTDLWGYKNNICLNCDGKISFFDIYSYGVPSSEIEEFCIPWEASDAIYEFIVDENIMISPDQFLDLFASYMGEYNRVMGTNAIQAGDMNSPVVSTLKNKLIQLKTEKTPWCSQGKCPLFERLNSEINDNLSLEKKAQYFEELAERASPYYKLYTHDEVQKIIEMTNDFYSHLTLPLNILPFSELTRAERRQIIQEIGDAWGEDMSWIKSLYRK